MVYLNESSTRLAELIWRTVKLRVTILAGLLLALVVLWSALLTGDRAAQKIDSQFCRTITDQYNEVLKITHDEADKALHSQHPTPIFVFPVEEECVDSSSRKWIEILRLSQQTELPLIDPPDAIQNILNKRPKEFAEYDAQRVAAFRMNINLSSELSGGSIEANTLSVAKFAPFCVIAALVAYFILGFQEESYRRQLERVLKQSAKDRPAVDLALAETQFFTLARRPVWHRPGSWFVQSPDRIAKVVLLLAVIFCLAEVISNFIAGLLHLTDTIFFGYPFNLYLAFCLALLVLQHTRRVYLLQRRVCHRLGRLWIRLRVRRFQKWVSVTAAFLGTCSLVLPWAVFDWGDKATRGYEFLLGNRVESRSPSGPTYQFDPRIFGEIRVQLWIAIAFLVASGIWAALRRRPSNWFFKLFRTARSVAAAFVILLVVNYLVYMAILEYEAVAQNPWMDSVIPGAGQGWSMINYNPCYGFWIFVGCCATLVCIILSGWDNGLRGRRTIDVRRQPAKNKKTSASAEPQGPPVPH